jgi:hypothetical protein
MKKILSIALCLLLVITLTSCVNNREKSEDDVDTGTQEEGLWTISGRYCEAANGNSLLLSEKEGTIHISPADAEDMFDDLENGDEIEILVGDVDEIYPAEATVYSYTLIEKGTVGDLDPNEIQNLENLGWEFSFEVETKDVIGKTFIDEGKGLQGDDFTITFNEDNTFSYSEGIASSHTGLGTWSIEGNVITLYENDPEMKNSFEIKDDQLIWLEKESDNFIYIKLTDGEVFQAE